MTVGARAPQLRAQMASAPLLEALAKLDAENRALREENDRLKQDLKESEDTTTQTLAWRAVAKKGAEDGEWPGPVKRPPPEPSEASGPYAFVDIPGRSITMPETWDGMYRRGSLHPVIRGLMRLVVTLVSGLRETLAVAERGEINEDTVADLIWNADHVRTPLSPLPRGGPGEDGEAYLFSDLLRALPGLLAAVETIHDKTQGNDPIDADFMRHVRRVIRSVLTNDQFGFTDRPDGSVTFCLKRPA